MVVRISLVVALALAACGTETTSLVPDAEASKGSGSASVNPDAGPPFEAGALIIPMDLSYQATGMFQAYGLIYQLLRQGVHVYWMIDPQKSWHACTTADPCTWDCDVDGSGVKCAYPTASPDFYATTKIVWSDAGTARDTTLGRHGYRGGPFVIDEADHDTALAIIDIWNDQSQWAANPWAKRSVFQVVSVHEATQGFTGTASKTMIAAPTIAVFADGNEPIATGYLRAAGIPQSNGAEFPTAKCTATTCGPSTANPDMLLEEQIMGDLGTCNAPNLDHKNGALFDANGNPKFCQIMSMHWGVNERETVKCAGGNCPATQAECTGQAFTYNGHEVVAEVREFLKYSTHFFAECQAVNAYENTVPNPAWPFLDDDGRDGHFLTTTGTPPLCPAGTCTNANYQCVQNACNGQACCLPKPQTWQNLPGYEVAAQPASNTVKVLRPDVPYNQLDGAFGTTGGSEPAYNLSTYLGTTYKNNRQVTLLTGANGPGDQDLWMSGYLDGCGDIILAPGPDGIPHAPSCGGKISYLGGHQYSTNVPVTSGSQSQGTRLFLNALFEADCVTDAGDNGGGFGDTDGDGVGDGADADPNDPNKCGDSDADGCDDCSTGHLDLINDCGADGGGGTPDGGCCETGSGAGGALALSGLVAALLVRRRRK
ncbi:MAG: hypothetical protein HOV81_14565 [Kofleriaceae bacterium]|nr:hypothetical protein [Kofleriaceae bacterium]